MSTAAEFNELAQVDIPELLAEVFPDTLSVTTQTLASDSGGGTYVSASTNAYTGIPCTYEPLSGARFDSAGKLLSAETYKVTMPTHNAGARINLNPTTHRLVVDARGNEPAKTFRILNIGDDSGVVFEVTCSREN